MQTFRTYIIETADKMVGTVGSDKKGLRHVKNYVMPFLSSAGRKKTAKALEGHIDFGDTSKDGEHHDPNAEHTHELASKQGEHPAGTKVSVTHVTMGSNNSLIAHTKNHGSMSLAALKKPEGHKKPAITKGGFDIESKIAENLGTKAAGSTKHGYDFKYGENVRGKVKTVDKKAGGVTPLIRGESKLDKGKMGQSTFKHSKEHGWDFTNKAIGDHFKKSTIVGDDGKERSLIDHFNHYHSNGVIDRNYTIQAPRGSTRNYLNSSNVNALHVHDKHSNTGTTFTIGDRNELRGKTKLGHLGNRDLDSLDGTLSIEKTTTGSTQVAHRPKAAKMRELALSSTNDPKNHRDLTNPDHAKEFKGHVDKIK